MFLFHQPNEPKKLNKLNQLYIATAPCSTVKATMSSGLTSLEVIPFFMARAAAAPMAWPMAMQVHWARMPARAMRSADTMRPATVIRELFLGIRALKGTLGSKTVVCMEKKFAAFAFAVHIDIIEGIANLVVKIRGI